eukprot:TRINITY_DN2201_c0_g1_i1.p2 TRINITY_DN2201_c0_g1~~TRINITY_DN2201_c0_g1_i1.p2  ORF type:complete len:196 (+),score=9.25 TRINITY_DN2201_c0_g1_i1:456-1043(+)
MRAAESRHCSFPASARVRIVTYDVRRDGRRAGSQACVHRRCELREAAPASDTCAVRSIGAKRSVWRRPPIRVRAHTGSREEDRRQRHRLRRVERTALRRHKSLAPRISFAGGEGGLRKRAAANRPPPVERRRLPPRASARHCASLGRCKRWLDRAVCVRALTLSSLNAGAANASCAAETACTGVRRVGRDTAPPL